LTFRWSSEPFTGLSILKLNWLPYLRLITFLDPFLHLGGFFLLLCWHFLFIFLSNDHYFSSYHLGNPLGSYTLLLSISLRHSFFARVNNACDVWVPKILVEPPGIYFHFLSLFVSIFDGQIRLHIDCHSYVGNPIGFHFYLDLSCLSSCCLSFAKDNVGRTRLIFLFSFSYSTLLL